MKTSSKALCLVSTALLSACTFSLPFWNSKNTEEVIRHVPDYQVTGSLKDAWAYEYGSATLLEFGDSPTSLSIIDESGKSLEYEKIGRYYRIAGVLPIFTVSANGQSATFILPMISRTFSTAESAPALTTVITPALVSESTKMTHDRTASSIIRVSFPNRGTDFKPSPKVAKALIASAKTANRIAVRGRTDSRKAGRADKRISFERAQGARRFLINHGIESEKITVHSQSNGDFIAPNTTKEGRAMNRRVEFEFFGDAHEATGQSIIQSGNRQFRVSPHEPVCEVSVNCP